MKATRLGVVGTAPQQGPGQEGPRALGAIWFYSQRVRKPVGGVNRAGTWTVNLEKGGFACFVTST